MTDISNGTEFNDLRPKKIIVLPQMGRMELISLITQQAERIALPAVLLNDSKFI